MLLLMVFSGADSPQASKPEPRRSRLDIDFRQVTVFGVLVVPDRPEAIDPKLAKLKKQLQRLKPNSGFAFRGSESRRLTPGESLTADLGGGVEATTELLSAMNRHGKVQFKFTLKVDGQPEFTTTVTTPPNQVFYIEKTLPRTHQRLLIGVGGR
jgi:hypothetical protein